MTNVFHKAGMYLFTSFLDRFTRCLNPFNSISTYFVSIFGCTLKSSLFWHYGIHDISTNPITRVIPWDTDCLTLLQFDLKLLDKLVTVSPTFVHDHAHMFVRSTDCHQDANGTRTNQAPHNDVCVDFYSLGYSHDLTRRYLGFFHCSPHGLFMNDKWPPILNRHSIQRTHNPNPLVESAVSTYDNFLSRPWIQKSRHKRPDCIESSWSIQNQHCSKELWIVWLVHFRNQSQVFASLGVERRKRQTLAIQDVGHLVDAPTCCRLRCRHHRDTNGFNRMNVPHQNLVQCCRCH